MARILSLMLIALAQVAMIGMPSLAIAADDCESSCDDDCLHDEGETEDCAPDHDSIAASESPDDPSCPTTCAGCACGCCVRVSVVASSVPGSSAVIADSLDPSPTPAGRSGTTSHHRVFRPPRIAA